MSKWSDEWNKLSKDIREIGSKVEAEMRINQLMMEEDRVTKHYRKHMKDIEAHIRSLRDYIKE